MTIVRRQIPVCVVIKSLYIYTKLKCVVYGPDEAILALFSTQMFLLLILVYLVNSPKNACKGRFLIFYLHDDEKGKTRSSFDWQTSFPPWPKGKDNYLPTCPHRLTFVLG